MFLVAFYGIGIYVPKGTDEAAAQEDHLYITEVFKQDELNSFEIEIDSADWEWLLENPLEDSFRSCTVTVGGKTFYNVAIKPKGNSSLSSVASTDSDRFSFKLDFDEYVQGQTCFGLEAIALNNNMSDSTSMKEAISYDVYEFLGVATPQNAFAQVLVNGEAWGLYLAVEDIDETFMAREFGSREGNLYKPENMAMGAGEGNPMGIGLPEGMDMQEGMKLLEEMEIPEGMELPKGLGLPEGMELPEGMDLADIKELAESGDVGKMLPKMRGDRSTNLKYIDNQASSYATIREGTITKNTSDADFKNIIQMIASLNTGVDLEEHLDVDEVLKYLAVNTFLVNLDSYSGGMYHNYYLYEKDGKVQVLPWDLNMSFGGFMINDANEAINFPIDTPTTDSMENAPLISKLLGNEKYLEKYHGYLQEILDNYVNNGLFEQEVEKNDQLISAAVKTDPTAFYTYNEYIAGVAELKLFMTERASSVDAQLAGTQPSTEYGTIESAVVMSKLGGMNIGGMTDQQGGGRQGGAGQGKVGEGTEEQGKVGNADQGNNRQGAVNPAGGNQFPGMPTRNGKEEVGQFNPTMIILQQVMPYLQYIGLLLLSIGLLIWLKKYSRKRYQKK